MADSPSDQPDDEGQHPSSRGFLGPATFVHEHPALVASLVVSGIVILRITGAAKWNVTTAQALLSAGGTASIVLGAFISLFPFVAFWLLTIVASIAAYWVRQAVKERVFWRVFSRGVWLVFVIWFASIAVPVAFFWMVVLISLLAFFQSDRKTLNVSQDLLFLILLLAIVFVTTTNVWLPGEIIELSNGRNVLGYVIEDEGAWTTVLTDERRQIERIRSELIERRTVCATKAALTWGRSLSDRVSDSSESLSCEERLIQLKAPPNAVRPHASVN